VLNTVRKVDLDLVVTLGLTILGLAIAIGGVRLKVGSVSVPEPGFFPFLAGAVVAVLGLCRVVATGLRRTHAQASSEGAGAVWKAGALAAALAVYTAVLDQLGFMLATSLLAIAVMRIARPQSWVGTIVIAATLSVACYYVFSVLLKVSLPPGAYF
jgi:putative tricarboxylic transport membrane protein